MTKKVIPKSNDSSDIEFKLYSKLAKSNKFLHESALESGCLYYIHARNAHLGIWIPIKRGFIISRFKFDRNYLFIEYHNDTEIPYNTVKPFVQIEEVPFDNKQIQLLGQDLDNQANSHLAKSVLVYLNKKENEIPFIWIKDKNIF